jgi:hypothetical protein
VADAGYLQAQIESAGVRIRHPTEPEFAVAPSAHELDILEEATGRFEQRVAHLLESKETLERRQAELVEFRHVLRETASFFHVCAVQIVLMQAGDVVESVRTSLEINRVDDSESARLLDNDVEMGVMDRSSGTYFTALNIEYDYFYSWLTIAMSQESLHAQDYMHWREFSSVCCEEIFMYDLR